MIRGETRTFSLATPCPHEAERGADLELTALRERHGIVDETDAVLECEGAVGFGRLGGYFLKALRSVENAI